MSFMNRVSDWEREAVSYEKEHIRLKAEASEARKSGDYIIAEAYDGMALDALHESRRARRMAEYVKKHRTPNQTKVVLKIVLGEE